MWVDMRRDPKVQALLIKKLAASTNSQPIYWVRDVSNQPYDNRLSKRVSTVTVVVTGVGHA
jgi:hypothetical protein